MINSPRLEEVIIRARAEAERLKHKHVSGIHLLIGIVFLSEGFASNLLTIMHISRDRLEKYLSCVPLRDEKFSGDIEIIPLGESAVNALSEASEVARRRNSGVVGVEDLLIALVCEPGGDVSAFFDSVRFDRDFACEALKNPY